MPPQVSPRDAIPQGQPTMTPPRFLLDEHVPQAIQSQLLRLDARIDVLVVGQPLAPPKGTSDPDILAWIEKTGYILVTGKWKHYSCTNTMNG